MPIRTGLLLLAADGCQSCVDVYAATDRICEEERRGHGLTEIPAKELHRSSARKIRALQDDKFYLVPFPSETTRPYSVARRNRSNMRQVSSDTFVIASSPSRSLRRNDVITQIT